MASSSWNSMGKICESPSRSKTSFTLELEHQHQHGEYPEDDGKIQEKFGAKGEFTAHDRLIDQANIAD